MPEVYSWNEGKVYGWNSTFGSTSALIGYAQDMTLTITYGWENKRLVTGTYIDVLTGQRADLQIGALYTTQTIADFFRGMATATNLVRLNVHVQQSALVGGAAASAGWLLYTGVMDRLELAGSEGAPYTYRIAYHSNLWLGYG